MAQPTSDNVHYLKQAPKDSASKKSFEDLVAQLSDRLGSVESELKGYFEKQRMIPSLKEGSAEITQLIRDLEGKVRSVSEDIQRQTRKKRLNIPVQETLQMLTSFNKKQINEFFKMLWFGRADKGQDVDEFGMDPHFIKKLKPLFDFLYYTYWRVKAHGVAHVPAEGRALIVANHSGTLPYDGGMIAASIINDHPSRRDVRFLVEDFVYHFPFLGTLMYRIGGVRACPENAERLLSTNHLVTVFPEGVKGIGKMYKHRYRLQRFGRGGYIKLALKTQSPLIPTAVIGAEEIHPLIYKSTLLAKPLGVPYVPITPTLPLLGLFGLIPLPSKWAIYFGEPFEFHKQYGPEESENPVLINQLSEMVRAKIQTMIMDGLKQRRSVWLD